MALIGSGFDHHAFDRYGEWYDEKSTARFAQTELFEGVKEIEEYVGITSERSPYLELGEIIDVTATVVERSDDGECVVLYATLMALKATPLGGGLGNMNAATLFTKLHFRILAPLGDDYWLDNRKGYRLDRDGRIYIRKLHFFYDVNFLLSAYAGAWNNDGVRGFVCDVLQQNCTGAWMRSGLESREQCVQVMGMLPTVEGPIGYINGKSQGCRYLHAAFAYRNPHDHCAHVSLAPREDPKGRIRCQFGHWTGHNFGEQSEPRLVPEDLFGADELSWYAEYKTSLGLDASSGLGACQCKQMASRSTPPPLHHSVFGDARASLGGACTRICSPSQAASAETTDRTLLKPALEGASGRKKKKKRRRLSRRAARERDARYGALGHGALGHGALGRDGTVGST